jgi:hypothetical protein
VASLVEILKSKGKLGAVGLMLLGLGMCTYSYFKGSGEYQEGMVTFFVGLSLLGIRGKQDAVK